MRSGEIIEHGCIPTVFLHSIENDSPIDERREIRIV